MLNKYYLTLITSRNVQQKLKKKTQHVQWQRKIKKRRKKSATRNLFR